MASRETPRVLAQGEGEAVRFAGLGAPVHTHSREDEYSYVLEGAIGVQVGDEDFYLREGDLVLKPRGVPHAFWNPTNRPARILEMISPAGFENYFRELAPLI